MRDMLSPMLDEVAAAMNAVAATMRRMPSEIRARFLAEAEERRLLRARFREERKLDELLDRIFDDGGTADQDDGDPVGAREDRGPLPPRIAPLFGLLIGVLAVGALFAMLALLSRF
jgi:hypothetical protein